MKGKFLVVFLVLAAVVMSIQGFNKKGCYSGVCSASEPQPTNAVEENGNKSQAGDVQVTFVELGSKKCIPCKMMQPVMESIEKSYAGKVKVVFYDVWTEEGKPYGQKYGILAIPTQVFLDKDGNEFYRHTGFLAENLIVDLLEKQGVTKE